MKINQVEQAIGITKKNIRFYEQEGLLKPTRVANGYRDYSAEDLETLRQIKLLRKLDIPIEEIRRLQENRQTLDDCLHRHLIVLKRRRSNLDAMESFCHRLLEKGRDLRNLEAEQLLQEMEQQEEGGVRFVDIRKGDKKKQKKIAVIAAISTILMMLLSLALPIWLKIVVPEMPMPLLLILILLPTIFIIGTLLALRERLNLRERLKEIEGGEMDEAAKY